MAKIIYNGVSSLYAGNPYRFFQSVEQVFALLAFDCPIPTDKNFSEKNLTRRTWKRLVWKIANEYCIPKESENVGDWLQRVRSGFERETSQLLQEKKSLGSQFQARISSKADKHKTLSSPILSFLTRASRYDTGYIIDTIHSVKGREFDAVCLFVPLPLKEPKTALASWFGYLDFQGADQILEPEVSGSARRVAYVAVTRAKRRLMVIIPENWYQELGNTEIGKIFLTKFDNKQAISLEDLTSIAPKSS